MIGDTRKLQLERWRNERSNISIVGFAVLGSSCDLNDGEVHCNSPFLLGKLSKGSKLR